MIGSEDIFDICSKPLKSIHILIFLEVKLTAIIHLEIFYSPNSLAGLFKKKNIVLASSDYQFQNIRKKECIYLIYKMSQFLT